MKMSMPVRNMPVRSMPVRNSFTSFSFPLMSKWLLSRSRRVLLTVAVTGVVVVVVNLIFSNFFLSQPREILQPHNILPYPPHNRQVVYLHPEESHQHKLLKMISKLFRNSKRKKSVSSSMCIHPELDLKHDVNQFAYHAMQALNCTGSSLFYVHNNTLFVNNMVMDPSKLGVCSFYAVKRLNDNSFTYKDRVFKKAAPYDTAVLDDFVRVRCVLQSTIEEERRQDEEEARETSLLIQDAQNSQVDEKEDEDKNILSLEMRKFHTEKPNGSSLQKPKPLLDSEEAEVQDYEGQELNSNSEFYSLLEGGILGDKGASYLQNKFDYEVDFDQFIVQVHPKLEVFERISALNTRTGEQNMKLSVLMIGLDSVSHLCFQRKLPLTYHLLKDELNAAILESYNIVGDATTAALIPILTGKTEMELPEARASVFESGNVDVYPFVWNHFRDQGYVTLFAEDEPSIATFNLRLNGFRDQPTDHYMRPFWLAVWDSSLRSNSQKYCSGATPHHMFMLQYLEDFFAKYHNVSKFAFAFHVELTHWDNNPAQYIDADLASFIRRLKTRNMLEDTVLVVMADHGARYGKVRHTVQGKLEERLPMMSFVFPPKFREKFPTHWKNLMNNRHKLSTPFDVHETLLDILDISRTQPSVGPKPRGMSLLQPIPENRTCRAAGIAMHWCSCLQQIALNTDEQFVKTAALAFVEHINSLIAPHRNQCAELHLTEIYSAFLVVPNEQVLKFRRSKDKDDRVANFSSSVDADVVHLQIQATTQPCGALFEATVAVSLRTSEDVVTVIPGFSRINKYGDQPACLQSRYPDMRKFCCCRMFLEAHRTINKKHHLLPMGHSKNGQPLLK